MVGSPWIGGGASGKAASISALSVGFRVAMLMYLNYLLMDLDACVATVVQRDSKSDKRAKIIDRKLVTKFSNNIRGAGR